MLLKYWQTKRFKDLSKQWETKLKASGFEDAEVLIKEERVLIQNSANCYRQAPQVIRENKEQYYTALNHCMEYMPPRDRIERLVMYYAAMGAKLREISDEIRDIGGPCHRQTIRFIVRKYEHSWGIRVWSEEKLNPKWRTTHIK